METWKSATVLVLYFGPQIPLGIYVAFHPASETTVGWIAAGAAMFATLVWLIFRDINERKVDPFKQLSDAMQRRDTSKPDPHEPER